MSISEGAANAVSTAGVIAGTIAIASGLATKVVETNWPVGTMVLVVVVGTFVILSAIAAFAIGIASASRLELIAIVAFVVGAKFAFDATARQSMCHAVGAVAATIAARSAMDRIATLSTSSPERAKAD